MAKPTRRDLAMLPVAIAAAASGRAAAQSGIAVDNATLADVTQALADGRITSSALTRAYLARIEAYDRAGPGLNSVREINPNALSIAGRLDGVKPSAQQPLAGVPILVKDNIATDDQQHTTAGSLALATARARNDATVVKLLRAAGAVILGKANLTEFANILAIDMPSGYSSLGGQVKNPYSPALLDDRGIPVVLPGGSSCGIGGRGRRGSLRGGDRHRDVGLAAQPRDAERTGHRETDRRPDQPRRHHPDRPQPGHGRSPHPHRARCGDPAQRARRARSARSRDASRCSGPTTTRRCSTRTG